MHICRACCCLYYLISFFTLVSSKSHVKSVEGACASIGRSFLELHSIYEKKKATSTTDYTNFEGVVKSLPYAAFKYRSAKIDELSFGSRKNIEYIDLLVDKLLKSFVPLYNATKPKVIETEKINKAAHIINKLYSETVEIFNIEVFFKALEMAVEAINYAVTFGISPISSLADLGDNFIEYKAQKTNMAYFLPTSKSHESTGYLDWHYIGQYVMEHAVQKSIEQEEEENIPVSSPLPTFHESKYVSSSPKQLIKFLGSRPDYGFFLHGAGWRSVVEAYERGYFKFVETIPEESHGIRKSNSYMRGGSTDSVNDKGRTTTTVELIVTKNINRVRDLCSLEGNIVREEDSPSSPGDSASERYTAYVFECHHGFGHGAFLSAVRSLIDSKLPLTFDEVRWRGEAICDAVTSEGWNVTGTSDTFSKYGPQGQGSCYDGLWMCMTQIYVFEGAFDYVLRDHEAKSASTSLPKSHGSVAEVGTLPSTANYFLKGSKREEAVQVWYQMVKEKMDVYPNFCFDHSSLDIGVNRHPKRSDSDQDILDAFCLLNGGIFAGGQNLSKVESCVELATTKELPNPMVSPVASLFCASYTGVAMMMSAESSDPISTMKQCLSVYNSDEVVALSSSNEVSLLLSGGCVAGVVMAARGEMRSPYGRNEMSEFDPSPYIANRFWEASQRRMFNKQVQSMQSAFEDIRYFSETTAFQLCEFLLDQTSSINFVHEDQLRLFGICMVTALSDHTVHAKEYGDCIFDSANSIFKANT